MTGIAIMMASPAAAKDRANQVTTSFSAREDRAGGSVTYMHAFSGNIAQEGYLLRLGGSAGSDDDGDDTRSGDLLLGYQFINGNWKVRTFGGITIVDKDDGGTKAGFKALVQLQTRKSDAFYLNATLGYNSAKEQVNAGVQLGTKVQSVIVGPEINVLATSDYTRTGFGAFLTGVKVGDVGLTFRAGYSVYDGDNADTRDSAYVGMSATLQF